MRIFGNLTNRIAETVQPAIPVVGMGVTILMHSDRLPATVTNILSEKRIIIQEDTAMRLDNNGQSENQEWAFSSDLNGRQHTVSLRKNGTWVIQGGSMHNGTIISVGERDKYYDFSF